MTDTPLANMFRSDWVHEWGVLLLAGLLALPLFTPRVYGADEIKYFATLRSLLVDRDLHYENEYAHFIERDPVAHAGLVPFRDGATATGYRLNDAPIGTALLWAPFYIAADGVVAAARVFGSTVPRDGYSRPYVWAVCLASLFWGLTGLALIYRMCRAYTDRTSATWAVLAVWFASPVMFYLYITPAMAHANSLFAVALFLTLWQRARSERTMGRWSALGAAAGLMVLVRELNWLGLAVVVVDELITLGLATVQSNRSSRTERCAFGSLVYGVLAKRLAGYLVFALALGVVVAPQFYVYKTLNGTYGPTPFIVDKFSPLPVYGLDVLFSGFHGLFSWHPITMVGALGLLAMLWRTSDGESRPPRLAMRELFDRPDARVAMAFVAFFVAQVLVVGSYETWWGGASFGARRFINCTALFALGAATWHARARQLPRAASVAMLAMFVVWNVGLTIQYSTGLIPRDAPVKMSRIVYNQFVEVPPRVTDIAWRFFFNRGSFYRTRF